MREIFMTGKTSLLAANSMRWRTLMGIALPSPATQSPSKNKVHASVSALGDASAHDAFSGQLFTKGPNRPGIVKGQVDPKFSHFSGEAAFSVSYPGAHFTRSLGPNRPLPAIELGTLFPLTVITDVGVTSDDLTNAYVDTGLRRQLSFFEIDGVTPVNVAEISDGSVPEPLSVYLTLGSLVGAFLLRRRAV